MSEEVAAQPQDVVTLEVGVLSWQEPEVNTRPSKEGDLAFLVDHRRTQPVGGVYKRIFDLVAAVALLIFSLPVFLLCAAAIRLSSPGPVIFRHKRVGFRGELFDCYKFRSMFVDADTRLNHILATNPTAKAEWEATQKLAYDPRVFAFGNFMRRSSLDELPQIINVLLGSMSLVGPRPIVRAEASRYGEFFSSFAAARPGITGLWQVSGRSDTSYAERVGLDHQYVTRWSFGRDLKILMRTVSVVLLQKGAR